MKREPPAPPTYGRLDNAASAGEILSAAAKPSATYTLSHVNGFSSNPFFSVHVCEQVLSASECEAARELAAIHVAEHGWQTKRHASFPTTDFAVEDCKPLEALLLPIVQQRVWPTLAELYGSALPGFRLSDLSLQDLFFIKYCYHDDNDDTKKQDEKAKKEEKKRKQCQDRLKLHRDGSLLSFSLLLSEPKLEFQGGGTYFASLPNVSGNGVGGGGHEEDGYVVRPSSRGDLTVHSGRLLHAGSPVTAGIRYLVVGFVHVATPVVDHTYLNRYPASGSLRGTIGISSDRDILTRCMKSIPPSLIERYDLDTVFCKSMTKDEDRPELPHSLQHPAFR